MTGQQTLVVMTVVLGGFWLLYQLAIVFWEAYDAAGDVFRRIAHARQVLHLRRRPAVRTVFLSELLRQRADLARQAGEPVPDRADLAWPAWQ